MPPAVARPFVLTDPGFLRIAALGTADPTNTVTGSVFTDVPAAAWLPLGATEGGSTLSYSTSVEPITVAEFFDPIKYATVSRAGSIAFNLADYTLSNWRRAMNGGVAAVAPTSGTGGTALYRVSPPDPGTEVRAMILWESTDSTIRVLLRQVLQGGEITSAYAKAPTIATIPCTFRMEVPTVGKPFDIWGTDQRGGV